MSRTRQPQWRSSPWRRRAFLLGVSLLLAGFLWPHHADAAGTRSGCGTRPGHTLLADHDLRFFFTRHPAAPSSRPGTFLCRNRGNKAVRVSVGASKITKPNAFGANGPAFWAIIESYGDGASDAGQVYSDVYVFPGPGRRRTSARFNNQELRDVTISRAGVVAAIADGAGVQPYVDGVGPVQQPATSAVVLIDPATPRGHPHALATGPLGTFTDLAATDAAVTWHTNDGAIHSAPLPAR